MFKKSIIAATAIAAATTAMTSTAHAGWAWVGNQTESSWSVYDYSSGGWSTVYTQQHIDTINRTIAMKQGIINQKNTLISSLMDDKEALAGQIATLEAEIASHLSLIHI